jgi:hypothetical protein
MRIARKSWAQVIRIDDERVQNYLRNAVRNSVEETLNAMLCGSGASLQGRPV